MTDTIIHPKMHHVNLKTIRLQEMIDWYGKVIGTRPLHQFEGGAWLSNDEANHRVALIAAPGLSDDPEKVTHCGMHHSAFEYESLDDLLASWERMDKLGIKPHMTLDHGMTTSFYYLDPDGNSVELQSDNFGDWSESAAFMMESKEFSANPIGVAVDPAKMLAARRAGVSIEEVQRRAYAGEYPATEPQDPRMPIEIPA